MDIIYRQQHSSEYFPFTDGRPSDAPGDGNDGGGPDAKKVARSYADVGGW